MIYKFQRLLVLALFALITLSCEISKAQQTRLVDAREQSTMINLILSSRKNVYTIGEEIDFTLTAENVSATKIDIPDFNKDPSKKLYFELFTPQQQKQKLSFTGIYPSTAGAGTTHTLNIAAKHWAGFTLNSAIDISETGSYSLKAYLTVDGKELASNEISFTTHKRKGGIASLAAGLVIRGATTSGEVAYVQDNQGSQTIYRYNFFEEPHVEETGSRALISMHTQNQSVDEVFIPQNNDAVMSEMSRWVVWRSGDTVYAKNDMNPTPVSWQSSIEIDSIVSAHKKLNGPVEIMLLSKSGNELLLLQANGGLGQPNPTLSLLWEAKLPVVADSALVVMPPNGAAGSNQLFLIEKKQDSYQIYNANLDEKGPGKFNQVLIKSGTWLTSVAPAARIDTEQHLSLATLALRPSVEGQVLILVTAQYSSNGKIEKIDEQEISLLAENQVIRQGSFAFSRVNSKFERLDLVLAFDDGSIKKLNKNSLVPVAVFGEPTRPLQIISASTSTYILYYSDEHGYYLEPI